MWFKRAPEKRDLYFFDDKDVELKNVSFIDVVGHEDHGMLFISFLYGFGLLCRLSKLLYQMHLLMHHLLPLIGWQLMVSNLPFHRILLFKVSYVCFSCSVEEFASPTSPQIRIS